MEKGMGTFPKGLRRPNCENGRNLPSVSASSRLWLSTVFVLLAKRRALNGETLRVEKVRKVHGCMRHKNLIVLQRGHGDETMIKEARRTGLCQVCSLVFHLVGNRLAKARVRVQFLAKHT